MSIAFPSHVIGLMSGTSADGVDAALLFTDGREVVQAGKSLFVPYSNALRVNILALMRGEGDQSKISYDLTDMHIQAVNQLIKISNVPRETISLIGFHGQTILHNPAAGITNQIGQPAQMAQNLGIPVVFDFRKNDIAHGGQGAPLVPLYHAALAASLPKPLMVVNIGGVANVTWIQKPETRNQKSEIQTSDFWLLAFDCGPGNALIDDWMGEQTRQWYDKDGVAAARGTADETAVAAFLADPFITNAPPKSLDRNHFSLRMVRHLPCDAGAATLTAMTAAAIAHACTQVPQPPKQLLITGGGRHNPTLMRMLAERAGIPVAPVESVGWDGDMLEAQAFAYLAARSVQGLPLSLPTTTGVHAPVSGGVLYRATV